MRYENTTSGAARESSDVARARSRAPVQRSTAERRARAASGSAAADSAQARRGHASAVMPVTHSPSNDSPVASSSPRMRMRAPRASGWKICSRARRCSVAECFVARKLRHDQRKRGETDRADRSTRPAPGTRRCPARGPRSSRRRRASCASARPRPAVWRALAVASRARGVCHLDARTLSTRSSAVSTSSNVSVLMLWSSQRPFERRTDGPVTLGRRQVRGPQQRCRARALERVLAQRDQVERTTHQRYVGQRRRRARCRRDGRRFRARAARAQDTSGRRQAHGPGYAVALGRGRRSRSARRRRATRARAPSRAPRSARRALSRLRRAALVDAIGAPRSVSCCAIEAPAARSASMSRRCCGESSTKPARTRSSAATSGNAAADAATASAARATSIASSRAVSRS